MLSYHQFTLDNELQVLVHKVPSSKTAVFNLMYKVGSGDEQPFQTGIAHLFEHLMFSRSKHVASYDKALQQVGGQNNAYTTFDVTNYYCVLPAVNLETAFWLESDRMLYLDCAASHLEVQRKVVIEEFKETCFNRPYGDLWHHLLSLAYEGHPYSWPTIGLAIAHIEDLSLGDIQAFGERFYMPSNAVLTVAGGVEVEEVKELSEKWFEERSRQVPVRYAPSLTGAYQRKGVCKTVRGEVPFNVVYHAYHIPGRGDEDYLALLVLAHLLGTGKSSFLYKKLVDELEWLTDVSVYTTEMLHGGLFIIEGELTDKGTFDGVEKVIREMVEEVCTMEMHAQLLAKAKNQLESEYALGHMNLFDRADSLAWAAWVGGADFFNKEYGDRLAVLGAVDIQQVGRKFFNADESVILRYCKR